MRIFVAGATGALGSALVPRLISSGHEVIGLARTPQRMKQLEALGVEARVADALDAAGVRDAVERSHPDAVVHALTAIPKNGPAKFSDLDATNTLRITGTKNLLAAAIAAGARRFVAESNMYVYGFGDLGDELLDEHVAVPRQIANDGARPIVDALISEERAIAEATSAGQIQGICLRFGGFYGPGSSEPLVEMLQHRRLPMPKKSRSRGISWIHIDDAADAVVAALDARAPSGIYNIADDEAVPATTMVRVLAQAFGAPEPFAVPPWIVRLAAPMGAVALLDTTLRLSTVKARRDLEWAPQFRTIEQGLRRYASTYAHRQESRTNANVPRDRRYGPSQ